MSKSRKDTGLSTLEKLNSIKPATNIAFNILFAITAFLCFMPIIFVFIISITDNNVIKQQGYQFFVTAETFSSAAYEYLWSQRATILQALWVSIYVTVLGTVIGVLLTTLMGSPGASILLTCILLGAAYVVVRWEGGDPLDV